MKVCIVSIFICLIAGFSGNFEINFLNFFLMSMLCFFIIRLCLGIVERTNVSTDDIGKIICGTVVQECRTSNIAREASITGGLPDTVRYFYDSLEYFCMF